MYISCLIGFIIIFSYCALITIKDKKLPNSISQMVYSLSNRLKWTFTAVMIVIAFMIIPMLMIVATDNFAWLAFLVIGGILGVGVDPLDKNKRNIIHYTSAIIMGISSQVLVFLIEPFLLLMWTPYICYTLYEHGSDKNTFLGEIVMLSDTALLCLL